MNQEIEKQGHRTPAPNLALGDALPNLDTVGILRFAPDARIPSRAHPDDAGLDLYGLEDLILHPGEGKAARSGIGIALPLGYMGLVADRSSMAKRGVKIAGGVIDSGYRGEIHVVLWNISKAEIQLKAGERIAQLIILPVAHPKPIEVREFDQTQRGAKGFGSTGA